MTIQSKLFMITDQATEMGVIATRLQAQVLTDDNDSISREQGFLRNWGYDPGYEPFYLLLSSIRNGNPIQSGINAYEFRSTLHFAFIKILANWDELTSGDEVNVQVEREAAIS